LAPTFFHTKTRAMTLALTAEPHRAFYTLITLLLSRPRVSVTIDASMSTLYFSGRQYVIRRLNPNNPDLCTAMLDYVASTAMSRFIFQFGADVFPYQNPCNDARVNS
jgi:hypothetical protein